ncbi:hypothetical protein BT96DRAFT_937961 [Gymnopus androsaceus JB14]|uniref:Uncharacterized protein n=1 Tax=Gymnopus androsaceus JB14 TaxID=1447944 RepID=A0A6A4HQS5_9AGAR|nr:hypothetical protein BT96DRAFT_937961 [Gymnopus androsaceus JB14]
MSSRYHTRSQKLAAEPQTMGSVLPVPENCPSPTKRITKKLQEAVKPTEDRSYRDLVAPRTAKAVNSGPSNPKGPVLWPKMPPLSVDVGNNKITSTNSELTSAPESDDDNEEPWTTVGPRRSRLFNNLADYKPSKSNKPVKLTSEQKATVQAAERLLTPAQQNLIQKRNDLIQKGRRGRSRSPNAGPSSYVTKGKFGDRNNEISDSKLNVEVQKAALENWNAIGKASKPGNKLQASDSDHSDHEHRKDHKKSGSSKRKECMHKKKKARIEAKYSSDSESGTGRVHKRDSKRAKRESKVALKEMLKPMSSTYAKQLHKVVKGHTPTLASQHGDKPYTKPVNQLPEGSSLAKVLGASASAKKKKSSKRSKKGRKNTSSSGSDADESDSSPESSSESGDDESSAQKASSGSSNDEQTSGLSDNGDSSPTLLNWRKS